MPQPGEVVDVESLASGAPHPLAANHPLLLDDPATAYLVRGGPVQLFAVELVNGEPGLHLPLFTASPGDLLLGTASASVVPDPTTGAATEMSLLAAGLGEDAMLLPLDRHALESSIGTVPGEAVPGEQAGIPGWLAAALERWSDSLASVSFPAPAHHHGIHHGDGVGAPVAGRGPGGDPDGILEHPGASRSWEAIDGQAREVLAAAGEHLDASHAMAHERLRRLDQHHVDLRKAAYTDLSAVVRRRGATSRLDVVAGEPTVAACRLVAQASGIDLAGVPHSVARAETGPEIVEALAAAGDFRVRRVRLSDGWWQEDGGPLLGWLVEDHRPVALLPPKPGRYRLVDPEDEGSIPVDSSLADLVAPDAYAFTRVLPRERVTAATLVSFALAGSRRDLWRVAGLGSLVGLLSLLPTLVAKSLFDTVVPLGDRSRLVGLVAILVAAALARATFSFVQFLSASRTETRVATSLQTAVFARLLDLPAAFYRRFGTGDLALRAMSMERLTGTMSQLLLVAVVSGFLATFNLAVLFAVQPLLAFFALVAVGIAVGFATWLFRRQVASARELHGATGRLLQSAIGLVGGLAKLRVAQAEDRAFANWAARFGELKKAGVSTQTGGVRLATVAAAFGPFATGLVLAGATLLPVGSLSPGTFLSFNTSFTEVLVAIMALASVGAVAGAAVPLYDRVRPIVEALPERASHHADPGPIRGALEASHVSFRYSEDDPLVLDDVSFSASPGEMIALVGPSGSGKSSLLRLLLGFETPELGMVTYDGQDLAALDARALRRQLGVVTQGARLLPDDILHNILGSRGLTVDDAWEAAEIACIADYIRSLPMGMQTFVSEGGGTFSGGQRQLLMIARAVAGRPRIVFFDEATSALDNVTQARVMERIGSMLCTRVVIAHRLSTVQMADRIVVLVNGRVDETGTFSELMAAGGTFSELAERQLL